jgi:hypothetical protein
MDRKQAEDRLCASGTSPRSAYLLADIADVMGSAVAQNGARITRTDRRARIRWWHIRRRPVVDWQVETADDIPAVTL